MVKITDDSTEFPSDSKYDSYFESFPYPLSSFQKHAIAAIVDGDHALVCAPTGSGKTLPAEFAIRYLTGFGKRIIYCSPIKALSNQKLFDFTRKHPDITFGLLTGDIKTNPTAQVLIMTTEILMNRLFTMRNGITDSSSLSFDMDIENDLGAVIFDELHYINDKHRGHVWEQSILMLPRHVQMVMLSATLDDPVKFARWCEGSSGTDRIGTSEANAGGTDRKGTLTQEGTSEANYGGADYKSEAIAHCEEPSNIKPPEHSAQVVICSTNHRIVPLTHYTFTCSSEGLFKKVKNKELEERVRSSLNECMTIKTATGEFIEDTYFETGAILNLMSDNNTISRRKFVLNELFTHLKSRDMLPAIVFIFSRRLVEQCAEEITVPLYDSDLEDYNPFTVRKECEAVLRRLPNWREYADLPEYQTLVGLLEKGIGIHHSGMIPVLREIVELMISKKYIKVLFATESFAIGLDCPIKTAVFISLKKFDGSAPRYLLPHEYTQMAGRAGRRGLDTVGHVIHCANLFEQPELEIYKEILCGKPQKLVSKFQVYYPTLLNVLKTTGHASIEDLVGFADKSMMKSELKAAERGICGEIEKITALIKVKEAEPLVTPRERLAEYTKLLEMLPYVANKKRKDADATIKNLKDTYPSLEKDYIFYKEYNKMVDDKELKESQLVGTQQHVRTQVCALLSVMEDSEIVSQVEPGHYELTSERGVIASRMAEINPVLMAQVCEKFNYFDTFSPAQLAGFFSLFTDVRVAEEIRMDPGFNEICYDEFLNNRVREFERVRESLIAKEERARIYGSSGLDDFCYDILDDVLEWCECSDEIQCKQLIMRLYQEKGVSVGDFTKAVMKISTVSREMQGFCEVMNKTEFMHKLASIDRMVLKYVATSQSLYL